MITDIQILRSGEGMTVLSTNEMHDFLRKAYVTDTAMLHVYL